MTTDQPLTDDELAAMDARAQDNMKLVFDGNAPYHYVRDVTRLLAEVSRLRTQVKHRDVALAEYRRNYESRFESENSD